jgi:hypothetical protein
MRTETLCILINYRFPAITGLEHKYTFCPEKHNIYSGVISPEAMYSRKKSPPGDTLPERLMDTAFMKDNVE